MSKITTEYLKHVFTEEEKRDIAVEMAQKVGELSAKEDDKKAIASAIKSEMDKLQAVINAAAAKLNTGYEIQPVKCQEDYDKDTNRFILTRLDTGEVVSTRKPRQEEMQLSFGGAEDDEQ